MTDRYAFEEVREQANWPQHQEPLSLAQCEAVYEAALAVTLELGVPHVRAVGIAERIRTRLMGK